MGWGIFSQWVGWGDEGGGGEEVIVSAKQRLCKVWKQFIQDCVIA